MAAMLSAFPYNWPEHTQIHSSLRHNAKIIFNAD